MASHEEVFFAVEPKKRKKYFKNILKKDLTYCIPFGTLITIRKERGGRKMAQYTITYKCGHNATVNLFGKVDDRKNKIAWMEKGLCKECYIKAQNAEIKEADSHFKPLSGSEKQITWAMRIRKEFTDKIFATIPDTEDGNLVKNVFNQTLDDDRLLTAKFWIDNRDNLKKAIDPIYQGYLGGTK